MGTSSSGGFVSYKRGKNSSQGPMLFTFKAFLVPPAVLCVLFSEGQQSVGGQEGGIV